MYLSYITHMGQSPLPMYQYRYNVYHWNWYITHIHISPMLIYHPYLYITPYPYVTPPTYSIPFILPIMYITSYHISPNTISHVLLYIYHPIPTYHLILISHALRFPPIYLSLYISSHNISPSHILPPNTSPLLIYPHPIPIHMSYTHNICYLISYITQYMLYCIYHSLSSYTHTYIILSSYIPSYIYSLIIYILS